MSNDVASADDTSHANKPCMGGEAASCRCLLSCPIFGAAPQKCANKHKKTVVRDAMMLAARQPGSECASIRCIVECSRQLECLDRVVTDKCYMVKLTNPDCGVQCEDTTTTSSTSTTRTSTTTSTSVTTSTTTLTTTPYIIILGEGFKEAEAFSLLVVAMVGAVAILVGLIACACRLCSGGANDHPAHIALPSEEPQSVNGKSPTVSSKLPLETELEAQMEAAEDLEQRSRKQAAQEAEEVEERALYERAAAVAAAIEDEREEGSASAEEAQAHSSDAGAPSSRLLVGDPAEEGSHEPL